MNLWRKLVFYCVSLTRLTNKTVSDKFTYMEFNILFPFSGIIRYPHQDDFTVPLHDDFQEVPQITK